MSALLGLLLTVSLAGCGDLFPYGTLDLYHDLQGGPIADQRPPPPGVDQPYPNLGTTPARPLAPDVAAEQRVADTLAAQRDAAAAAAAADPIAALPPAPPPPKPPADDPNGNKVVVDAAPAPPPVRAAPPAAAPALAPAPADPVYGPTIPTLGDVPAVPTAVASGPLPAFAAAPPPIATGLEIAMPLPPPTPPIVAAPSVSAANSVTIAFTRGSTTLPPSATLALRRLFLAHPNATVDVTGRGDGGPKDADSQSRALELAFKRAAAIATSLNASGLQLARLRLHADALGTGSAAVIN